MTTTIIGATGRVGSAVVRRLLETGQPVRAYVRDADKARRIFGQPDGLEIYRGRLDDPDNLAAGLGDASCIFMALGSIGTEGNLQRAVIEAASGSTALRQFVRLSVLNASPTSLGINQRAHWNIDCAASAAQIPYTTIRPAIFSASLLAGAAEIRARRAWTGIADTGQVGLIDHADVAEVAARILTDPATWETHYDLTGPMLLSWPRAMALLSAELGYLISFETLPERQLLTRLIEAGVAPGQAELLIAREWAIQAGENDRLTDTVRELAGHAPRTVEAFLHDNRRQFLQTEPRTSLALRRLRQRPSERRDVMASPIGRPNGPKLTTDAASGKSGKTILASSLQTIRGGTDGPGSFAFSNLSGRAPGRFLRTASRLLAGVGKVEHQIAPYAASWHERNITALGTAGPLWVVLGDSISQGVGASSVEQGWVLQAWRILAEQGIHYRIVNLSISGATITDVIEREIPAMKGLAAAPAVVTVFIGSNDILHHDLRMSLAAHYEELIDALPAGSLIAVTSQARGALAEINRTVAAAAATGAIQAVPVRIAQGKRAEDHFHPSDEGYSLIAADFAAAIAARDRQTPASDGDETSGRQRPGGTTPP